MAQRKDKKVRVERKRRGRSHSHNVKRGPAHKTGKKSHYMDNVVHVGPYRF